MVNFRELPRFLRFGRCATPASLTAAEGRAPRRPTPEPRADRDARHGETVPLAVPVTAAFIGLLLLRDAVWAEESAAGTVGEAGAVVA